MTGGQRNVSRNTPSPLAGEGRGGGYAGTAFDASPPTPSLPRKGGESHTESGRIGKLTEGVATVASAVAAVTSRLAAAGIPEPRREARLLAAAALGVTPSDIFTYPERPVDAASLARLDGFAARRADAREPVSRILGRREFWSLDFALSPDTLDPRPDSETLVEAALDHIRDRAAPLRVLDFGTGSGCLLLALLSELPNAVGTGIDLAVGAARQARANARALGLADRASFVVGDWGAPIAGRAAVILSNPPYIRRDAIAGLRAEVAAHDPRRALDGGTDGLDAYRMLAGEAARLLAPDGVAVFEVGDGQADAVVALMRNAGLRRLEARRDLAGVERGLVLAHDGGCAC